MPGRPTTLSSRFILKSIHRNFRSQSDKLQISKASICISQYRPRDIIISYNQSRKMSTTFSNTDTGDKPSGPYYNKNIDNDATLKEKVETLTKFVSSCKFGMMTTRDSSSGKLVSRCMAIAGKVSHSDVSHFDGAIANQPFSRRAATST